MGTTASLFDFEKVPIPKRRKVIQSKHGNVPSLIKWTGSKRSQAARILAFVPEHGRYFEPFLGGGALLYFLGNRGSVCGDIYRPLIELWMLARDEPDRLIADYESQWEELQANLPDYYYIVRRRFNERHWPEDLNFLMRTCVNGIVRFNRSGKFNNSFHLSRKGMLPSRYEGIVRNWHTRLQGVEFRIADFEETLSDAKSGDFVYLDPPYGGNNQRYIGNLDFHRFCEVLDDMNRRKVKWALSFDGFRGDRTYDHEIPTEIYGRRVRLDSGYSAVSKVLNGPVEMVTESLYLNY